MPIETPRIYEWGTYNVSFGVTVGYGYLCLGGYLKTMVTILKGEPPPEHLAIHPFLGP